MVVSRAVISALGDAGSKQAIPPLQGILENQSKEELHALTITVLGEIGGREITPTLLQALESLNDQVRFVLLWRSASCELKRQFSLL